jgi:hypothetical protein
MPASGAQFPVGGYVVSNSRKKNKYQPDVKILLYTGATTVVMCSTAQQGISAVLQSTTFPSPSYCQHRNIYSVTPSLQNALAAAPNPIVVTVTSWGAMLARILAAHQQLSAAGGVLIPDNNN